MKTILYFLLTVSATLLPYHQSVCKAKFHQHLNLTYREKEPVKPNACLAQADAEKILGQPAKLTESSSENENGIKKFRCTYTVNTTDPKTNKTANLYYLLEEFKDLDASQKTYSNILEENEDMSGLKELNTIGDQAFLHTDNENFLLIISRKGNMILRLKVNKLTSTTSVTELQNVSKAIIEMP